MPNSWGLALRVEAKDLAARRKAVKVLHRQANAKLEPGSVCEVNMGMPDLDGFSQIVVYWAQGMVRQDIGTIKRPVYLIPAGYYRMGNVTTY